VSSAGPGGRATDDRRLDAIGTDEAKEARGTAALANARLAYQAYEEVFGSADGSGASPRPSDESRWAALDRAGANKQRPLWASTGVKDPSYPDTVPVDWAGVSPFSRAPRTVLGELVPGVLDPGWRHASCAWSGPGRPPRPEAADGHSPHDLAKQVRPEAAERH
jgi:hypothetical protein